MESTEQTYSILSGKGAQQPHPALALSFPPTLPTCKHLLMPAKAQKLTLCLVARVALSCAHVLVPGAQAERRPELGHVQLCCQLPGPVPDLQGANQQGSWLKGNML